MTARRIVIIFIGLAVLAGLAAYVTRAPKPRVETAAERQRRANEAALESLKETQDEVNKLKAHGVK